MGSGPARGRAFAAAGATIVGWALGGYPLYVTISPKPEARIWLGEPESEDAAFKEVIVHLAMGIARAKAAPQHRRGRGEIHRVTRNPKRSWNDRHRDEATDKGMQRAAELLDVHWELVRRLAAWLLVEIEVIGPEVIQAFLSRYQQVLPGSDPVAFAWEGDTAWPAECWELCPPFQASQLAMKNVR